MSKRQWTYAGIQAILEGSITESDDGALVGASARLFTNELVQSPNNILADLTIPTWAGPYADIVLTWLPSYRGPDGLPTLTSEGADFVSGADADVLVYGYGVFLGTVLYWTELFDAPQAVLGVQQIPIRATGQGNAPTPV